MVIFSVDLFLLFGMEQMQQQASILSEQLAQQQANHFTPMLSRYAPSSFQSWKSEEANLSAVLPQNSSACPG